MNSLTITLCVLIEATMIMAKTERLSAKDNINPEKLIVFYPADSNPSIPLQPNNSLYNYNYNTDTGIQVQEDGHLNNVGTDEEALEARGSYSYTDNEGNSYQVSYIANENGFQPEGAHLPQIPPLIQKALQYNAEHPEENGQ